MSPIDMYIRRVTLGLPRKARLDTAAELRVHLNERTSALTSQGLDHSEAEHLAVEYMGPIEPVNRKFLGHVLTPRLGWLLVGVEAYGLDWHAAGGKLFQLGHAVGDGKQHVVPTEVDGSLAGRQVIERSRVDGPPRTQLALDRRRIEPGGLEEHSHEQRPHHAVGCRRQGRLQALHDGGGADPVRQPDLESALSFLGLGVQPPTA